MVNSVSKECRNDTFQNPFCSLRWTFPTFTNEYQHLHIELPGQLGPKVSRKASFSQRKRLFLLKCDFLKSFLKAVSSLNQWGTLKVLVLLKPVMLAWRCKQQKRRYSDQTNGFLHGSLATRTRETHGASAEVPICSLTRRPGTIRRTISAVHWLDRLP